MKHETHCAEKAAPGLSLWILIIVGGGLLSSCETISTVGSSSSGQLPSSALTGPAVQSRNAEIAMEPTGDYYIGRRWWVDGTRFWGYLRKPRQPWSEAKLVIMNERVSKQPDRIPEEGVGSRVHGYDHNYEYRIWGRYTGQKIYDPNSNFILPEFQITRYEMVNAHPGFLFWPGESYSPRKLPPKHPPTPY